MINDIVIYGKPNCPWCDMAKELSENNSYTYTYVNIAEDEDARQALKKEGFKTVPQIYFKGKHIGGYDKYELWMENNK